MSLRPTSAPDAPPTGGPNFVATLALVATLILIAAALGYRAITDDRDTRNRIHALAQAADEIRYCDEVLTMSARMAVFTGEPRWDARYREFVPKLQQSLDSAAEFSPQDRGALEETGVANLRLIRRETRAIELARSGRRQEATRLLLGEEYEADKVSYAAGLTRLTDALEASGEAAEASLRRDLAIAGAAIAALFGVIAFILGRAYRTLVGRLATERTLATVARDLAALPGLSLDERMRRALTTICSRAGAARAVLVRAEEGGRDAPAAARDGWASDSGVRRAGEGAPQTPPGSLVVRVEQGEGAGCLLALLPGEQRMRWGPRDLDVLRALGEILVRAVEISEKEAALTRLASTDSLTSLANRRSFTAQLDREILRMSRSGEPSALMMLDLDFFKSVNDRHGHAVGDAVLMHLAAVARSTVRAIDLVGRIGGEEFAVLMPGTDLHTGVLAAERLRRAVEGSPSPTDAGSVAVTISIGVTVLGVPGDSADRALGRADNALYAAKAGGRNCVRTFVATY